MNSNEKKPLLSIITVCLNDLDGLKATMNSVLSQEESDLDSIEHIILDGGSTDGTPSYLEEISKLYPHVQQISEPDFGVYDAMNKGISKASANYVQFLNSGDTYSNTLALKAYLGECSRESATPLMVVSGAQIVRETHVQKIRNVPHIWVLHAFGIRPHCHQAMIFDTKLTRAIGGYSLNRSFAADFEFILKIGLLSSVRYIPEVLINYQGGGISFKRRVEIPKLLHRTRRELFQYGKILTWVDLLFVFSLKLYRRIKK